VFHHRIAHRLGAHTFEDCDFWKLHELGTRNISLQIARCFDVWFSMLFCAAYIHDNTFTDMHLSGSSSVFKSGRKVLYQQKKWGWVAMLYAVKRFTASRDKLLFIINSVSLFGFSNNSKQTNVWLPWTSFVEVSLSWEYSFHFCKITFLFSGGCSARNERSKYLCNPLLKIPCLQYAFVDRGSFLNIFWKMLN